MRPAPTFLRAGPADARELADGLRAADARELALHCGLGPADGVALSCYVSEAVWAARSGGRLVAMFGGARDSVLSREGTIWALGTRFIDERPKEFLRWSRHGLGLVLGELPDVETFSNWVLVGNEASRRWLDWLGAWWTHDTEETPFGGTFRRFVIGR